MAAQTTNSFRAYKKLARQHGPVFKATYRSQPVCIVAGALETRLVPPVSVLLLAYAICTAASRLLYRGCSHKASQPTCSILTAPATRR